MNSLHPPPVNPKVHAWWHAGDDLDDAGLQELDTLEYFDSEDQTTHEFRLCLLPLEFLPEFTPFHVESLTVSLQDRRRIESIKEGMDQLGPLVFLQRRPLVWVIDGLEFDGEAPSLIDGWHRLYVIRGRGDLQAIPTVVARPRIP